MGLLCRLLGKNHPEPFVAFLATLVGPVVLQQDKDHEVKLSGFTCLAALIEVLGPRSLAHIGKFMPLLLNDAELVLATGAFEDVYITLSVLHTVVKTLPQFVSPYIGKILALLFDRRIHADGAASEEVQMTVEAVVGSLSSLVPARVLMPALFAAQQQTLIEGLASICRFYDLVGGVVAAMDRDTITAHYKQLFRFYLSAFDLRSQSSVAEELDENGLEIAERHIIDSFVRLVLKLNESMFKPLFLTMVDWATAAENESAQEDGDSETDTGARGYIFYKMVDELLGRLKSIFAPYYAYVLDHALQLLADYKEDGTWSPTWNYVMASFTKALRYDNDGLLSDDKLQSLVPVVVDQLSFAYDDAEEYAQRTATFVTPALLALIKSSPAVVKKLNHAVLMTTRHDDESVRFAALDAIQNFYELEEGGGLGEDLLQYLPETIPFLAEILEDGSERVEKKGRMVIAKIEGLLGESLHEHLRA